MKGLTSHGLALVALAGLCGLGLSGCADSHGPYAEASAVAERDRIDPWEGTNRKVFAFNEALDIHALEPVAREWDRIIPNQVQEWLTNFRSNLHYPVVFINDLFQARGKAAAIETGRFLVNTLLGFGGLFDPATIWGLPRREQDFGLTLGHWGIDTGRYLILPLLGPSTLRDLSGGIVDAGLGAASLGPIGVGWYIATPLGAVQVVNTRAAYLDVVDENRRAALDYYTFVRDAYLQHRESLLTEGGAGARFENDVYYPDTEADSP